MIQSLLRSLSAAKPAAGKGLLPSPRSFQDALVDEVGLVAVDARKDVVNLLRGAESVVVYALALAASTLTCAASAGLFLRRFDFCMKFHKQKVLKLKNKLYLCSVKPEVGEVSLPVWCQIQISNLILTFQTLSEIASLIRLQVFHSFLLFSRFSDSSVCLSLTIQRYEKFWHLPLFIKTRKSFSGRRYIIIC